MANKQILGLDGGRPATIGSNDVGVIDGDAQVGGNLTVAGDIVSRGAVDVVLQDQFLELANGQTSTTAAPAGYTATVASASGINYTVASFTAPTTITLTADDAGNPTFYSGSAEITTNLTATDTVAVQNAAASATTFTAVASGATGTQFNVGASPEVTAENLATVINGEADFSASAFGATVLIQLAADAGANNPTIVYTQNAGSGAVTVQNFSNNPRIPANSIIMLSNLDDTANDGIYAVASTAANTITVKAAGAINSQAPFLQSAVVTGAETGNNDVNFIDLYVQAVGDGITLRDTTGTLVPEGTLCDSFQVLASDADFANGYTIVGAGETTLNDAYTSGNTITTTSSRNIDVTLIAGTSFLVSGSGVGNGVFDVGNSGNDLANFNVGTGTFDINATGAVTVDGSTMTLTATDTTSMIMNAADGSDKTLTIQANNSGGGTGDIAVDADDNVNIQIAATTVLQVDNGGASLRGATELAILNAANNAQFILMSGNDGSLKFDQANGTANEISKAAAAAGDDLEIKVTGNQDAHLSIESQGTSANALSIATTTNGGGIDIDSVGALVAEADDIITIKMDANDGSNKSVTLQANNTGGGQGNISLDADNIVSILAAGNTEATIDANGLALKTGVSVNDIDDDDAFASATATALATAESIKAYVDSRGLANFGTVVTMTADASISFGQVVAIKKTGGNEGRALVADPTAVATSSVVGICVTAGTTTAGNPITVATAGQVSGLSGLTAGETIYASVGTPGALQSTAPTATGQTIYQVGYALSTSSVAIQLTFVAEIA